MDLFGENARVVLSDFCEMNWHVQPVWGQVSPIAHSKSATAASQAFHRPPRGRPAGPRPPGPKPAAFALPPGCRAASGRDACR